MKWGESSRWYMLVVRLQLSWKCQITDSPKIITFHMDILISAFSLSPYQSDINVNQVVLEFVYSVNAQKMVRVKKNVCLSDF